MCLSFAKTGYTVATHPRAPFLDNSRWNILSTIHSPFIRKKYSFASHRIKRSGMSTRSGTGAEHVNRLASETSPYLLQHAHNPVDWFPWGPEAFEAARQKELPIFLSIGYSTCHWCHVMAEESFESEDVADLLNKYFISVKVDREERPDVDKVYMTYVQALHGGGGWPLSVFLTPQLDPFFGSTYFPKEDAYGRPGFKTVLKRIADVWARQRQDIVASSAETMHQLGELVASGLSTASPVDSDIMKAIDSCVASLTSRFDPDNGGFSSAPKFPRPSELAILMAQYIRLLHRTASGGGKVAALEESADEARKILHMVKFTLLSMWQGGMHDHIGGGWARYSTDELWHVPHFEKELYDQAQLVQVYLDASTITKAAELAYIARETLDYMIRNLSLDRGTESAFCAAEDADSVDPSDGRKKEGFFYVWTSQEIDQVLGDGVGRMFKEYYGIQPEGNCIRSPRSDPHGEFVGKNVLYVSSNNRNDQDDLSLARKKMFEARQARSPPPHRDDKIIVAWNGMALSALARAGRVLMHEGDDRGRWRKDSFPAQGREAKEYIHRAIGLASFLKKHVWDGERKELFRIFSSKSNKAHVNAFSDDYALLIGGLLDLYHATGDVETLAWAEDLQRVMDDKFWDDEKGGYFQTSLTGQDESIKLRLKEDYDGAEPSANSIAVSNLWRLAGLSGTERKKELIGRAKSCAAAFSGRLHEGALAMPQMCCSLALLEGHARQVVIVGRRGSEDTEALVNAAYSVFCPDKIIIHLDLSNREEMGYWKKRSPEVVALGEASGMQPADRATAFVCQNFTCKAPTCEPDVLARTLSMPRNRL